MKNIIKRNSVFMVLLLVLAFLELANYNYRFFLHNIFQLQEQVFEIDQATLYGFRQENNVLVSEHNDPNLTYRNIDKHVKYILIECTNPNPDALSQVFYRKVDEDWSNVNSITFKLDQPKATIYLPRLTKITSLRFDLTDTEGDELTCKNIIVNPVAGFNFNLLRSILFLLCILGLIFGHKFIPAHVSEAVWTAFVNNGIWVFIILIILIDFTYPITITYDSGHYLSLANLIKENNFANWDVIRSIGYPLILSLSVSVLGSSQEALLIPQIISHCVFFIFACQIALEVIKPKKSEYRLLITFIIFLLIGLDPTVVGYFHVLLTEYIGATIAVISTFIAIKLLQSEPFTKAFYAYTAYFFLMAPVAWHIKQPYFGAAFFPFFIVCILIALRKFNAKSLGFGLIANVLLVALVFLSNALWSTYLKSHENPMNEKRQFSNNAEQRIERVITRTSDDPISAIKLYSNIYIASTNYRQLAADGSLGKPSWTYAFQNELIGHRMYKNFGARNVAFKGTDYYIRYVLDFMTNYNPIPWINNIFIMRLSISNFLFILSFLLLPIFTFFWFFIWVLNKSVFNSSILILAGTSSLNAFAHLLASPIDRYLFLGYPLNLLVIVLLSAKFVKLVVDWFKNLSKRFIHSS